jgi:TM2 domain-containing membrane protein YozV
MANSMHGDGSAIERVEPLLADANRLRAKGDVEAAEKRCRQALAVDPESWEAHELLGDILYQQRRGEEAIEHYRIAHAGNPERPVLEEKVGRASLLIAEKNLLRLRTEDVLAGRREEAPRRPAVAALLSMLIPGFGQIYNRELIKGAIILCFWLLLLMGAGGSALSSLHGTVASARPGVSAFDPMVVLTVFFSRPAVWWTMLALAAWVYGIVDAAIQAAKTMTAPEDVTGFVHSSDRPAR